jgi:hypothetical protein
LAAVCDDEGAGYRSRVLIMTAYLTNLGRALSRLGNSIIGGYSGEMLSARCHRMNWNHLVAIVDTIFFWEPSHCAACYETELTDRDRPGEYHSSNSQLDPN